MPAVDYVIREFGDGAPAPAADLARLHSALLAHSPLVLMGPEFVEDFYYTVLPAESLVSGAVAYVDGEAAGFIVATADPEGFMAKATQRHWLRIGWILAWSILRSPRRLFAVKEAYDIQKNVQVEDYGPDMGELLSFGVLPDYRSRAFLRETSLHIGADLQARAVGQMRSAGKKRIRAIVDKDNLEAQLFYRFHGWRVGLPEVKGWRVPTMEFLYDVDGAETNQTDES